MRINQAGYQITPLQIKCRTMMFIFSNAISLSDDFSFIRNEPGMIDNLAGPHIDQAGIFQQ